MAYNIIFSNHTTIHYSLRWTNSEGYNLLEPVNKGSTEVGYSPYDQMNHWLPSRVWLKRTLYGMAFLHGFILITAQNSRYAESRAFANTLKTAAPPPSPTMPPAATAYRKSKPPAWFPWEKHRRASRSSVFRPIPRAIFCKSKSRATTNGVSASATYRAGRCAGR